MPVHASMTVTLGLIAQKAGSHRYAPTDELESPPKSICVYVARRSNCRWPPKCSPLYLFCQTDTLYKSGTHLVKRDPITNRAKPDSPKVPFSGPIQIYQHSILLSIRHKHVDGFFRQRNCSPSISLPGKQCIAVHIYYLASNAYLYDLVLGKQGLHIQVLQIGKQCPDSCLLLCKQCTDPDLRQFLHRLVGNTSQTQKSHFVRAARFLQNASLYSCCCCRFECYNQYPFPQLFASAYSFLFTGTQIALW